ncbi:probable inactive purple acid phosphatase 27 isoform X2 [Malania oleifera]|uniref:probable inactive purple acid phosphatase 27 isoform X2 n=1 Tax=Malania oleifera TaxID=397392 RepID=UPI0025AEAD54|nr:probable inactive purple acid phosphatase 27 isoform X2 [Malania oleifera]
MNFPSFLSECFSASWAFGILVLCFLSFFMSCSSFSLSSPSSYPPVVMDIAAEFHNYTAISEFRMLNRRHLMQCPDPNEFIRINVSSNSTIGDEEFITVNVSGILKPAEGDWVAMISPSNSRVSACPLDRLMYAQTGDLSKLPLLCHYPVKAQFLSNDPAYLGCNKKECKSYNAEGQCEISTCSSSLSFHVINIRTDVQFVLFAGGFKIPCILKRSNYLSFANPHKPLYGHLSSIDSTGTSMRLTWVSGDQAPQQVQYGDSKSQTSQVSTFSQQDMCTSPIPSPAQDFGWHDPGYIHSAVMTGLRPSSTFSYRYGSDSVGWSDQIQFQTPPAAGSDKLKFLAFGDMGKAPLDASVEHYIQPGSITVAKAMADEVASGNIDSIFHIGDISYATGFLVEWDYFLHQIFPVASRVSYMTAIGNHERDYVYSGSKYITPDSGGECGVPYETYFQMPTPAQDKPWYSIEQASVHFTVISTEHSWFEDSEQYEWMKKDMASVNRSVTPWLIFIGHRPMYSSCTFGLLPGAVDREFVGAVESLLLTNKVDLVLFGHVHNYERTCRVYQSQCLGMPTKNADGIDVYDNSNYTAPVQAVIGMAGFTLDKFPENNTESWSLSRVSEYGYVRINATRNELMSEYVNANSREVEDSFCIIKKQASYQKYSACSRITICYTRIFSVVLCNFFICDLLQRIFCSMYIKSSLY